MFICSKLGQNLPEMEVRTFERTQIVIWDHLLPFKGEIIQKQALFLFIMLSVLLFLSCGVIRNFCWVWRKKVSLKGHSIDDSNEYKFIYVPSSNSSEKKNIFDDRWVFNFLPVKVWAGVTEAWIPMWQTGAIDTFFTFWWFLVAEQNFNFRFQCPWYKHGVHA